MQTFDHLPNINHCWGALLIEELIRCGVAHFVVSPGSRSTPLTWQIAVHPHARSTVHFDERGAAFYALGMARALRQPVALVCTSGSAAANYLPAVVEAAQTGVPLLLLTADRPPELLDTGANQAIAQPGIFGSYLRWEHLLPCPDTAISPQYLLTTADHAVHCAQWPHPGPVHLDCMFREPLAPAETGENLAHYLAPLADWRAGSLPFTRCTPPQFSLAEHDIRSTAHLLNETRRGLLVVGALRHEREAQAATALAAALGWPVVADALANLRHREEGLHLLWHADHLLLSPRVQALLRPQRVLHLGAPLTSRRITEHLAGCGARLMFVSEHLSRQDPLHRASVRYFTDVETFCQALLPHLAVERDADWIQALQRADAAAEAALQTWMKSNKVLTEIHVARLGAHLAPENSILFAANSMPVRDLDFYGGPCAAWITANRGASGIDGNIATAAGWAAATGAFTQAIVGDLAALHDLNSLALLRGIKTPFALVAANNDGGGIFSFLPVAQAGAPFEAYFGTPHGLGFEHAAAQFGLRHAQPRTPAEFRAALRQAQRDTGATLIEIRTQRAENAAHHRALQAKMLCAVEQSLA